jgi:hypothetical protein
MKLDQEIATKTCKTCLKEFSLGQFHKNASAKDGHCSSCKECVCHKKRQDYQKDPAKFMDRNKVWKSDNQDWVKAYEQIRGQAYYSANREKILNKNKAYVKNNPDKHRKSMRVAASKRRGVVNKSCPKWLTDDQHAQIKFLYDLARDCEITAGQKYHVDHIVPLQGKNVCGLHVPWNLQVLPADINMSKGNRYE